MKGRNRSASQISAVWRGKQARKEFETQKWAVLKLTTVVRRLVARNKVRRIERMQVRPLIVRLLTGDGLRAADRNTSDPFVIICVSKTESSPVIAINRSRLNCFEEEKFEEFLLCL